MTWRNALPFSDMDISSLERDLKNSVSGEVRFDVGSRALYSTDSSNYRQAPIGVVVPRTMDDVIAAVAAARKYNAPILNRGGGTSLAGQCCNTAIVIDMSKYLDGILELDPAGRIARVQPGVILDDVRAAAERHHLTYGPDPATHNHCTLGGMIGNNSCGMHSVMAGKTDENIEELDILTYRGCRIKVGRTGPDEYERIIRAGGPQAEIYRKLKELAEKYAGLIRSKFPNIPRRVSGYNLPYLLPENGFHIARALVGSESTCVTILEAALRLVYSPPGRSLVVFGYPDVYRAADHVVQLLDWKPIAIEGVDANLINGMRKKNLHTASIDMLPPGGGWLFVEFGAETKPEADNIAKKFMEFLKREKDAPSMKLLDDPASAARIWKVRESALGASAFVPGQPDTWEGWEDSAVAPEKMGGYLRDLRLLYDKYHYEATTYGHFGQGCVHTRITFDMFTKEGVQKFRSFVHEAAELVVSYGGSLSGEHGDGQSRAELLPIMYGPELVDAFNDFKSIWDPDWRMNPGKIVDPYRADENLRYGPDFHSRDLPANFRFPNDRGSFARALQRCVGVGECRRMDKGTMCPSYRVTKEEQYSTRGRARLLWEMMNGNVLTGGWKEEAVKESLDLCLACKGCKADCPVNVDMATYKAEFLSHYYEGRLRPIAAYSFGMIHTWARIASAMPGFVNFLTQAPGFRELVKALAGIAPGRSIPRFAKQSFRKWFNARPLVNAGNPQVLLWPDTFNNYFHPHVAAAAVEVLEYAGYRVVIPQKVLCCGRPLYDHGMVKKAKKLVAETLETLHPVIEKGIPMVGLEPSCIAVFRDEMPNLFPDNEDALRLSTLVFSLGGFIRKENLFPKFPGLDKNALLHGHCHQKAIWGATGEEDVLRALGLNLTVLDSGCCGMAGSFGFEKAHYDISQQVGNTSLLPAVKNAPVDALIVADGFSCQEQIRQGTERVPLHLAQVLQMAIRGK